MSVDPALEDYLAGSNIGLGGMFNPTNMHLYHYANNNPVRYIDPDGAVVTPGVFTEACSMIENSKYVRSEFRAGYNIELRSSLPKGSISNFASNRVKYKEILYIKKYKLSVFVKDGGYINLNKAKFNNSFEEALAIAHELGHVKAMSYIFFELRKANAKNSEVTKVNPLSFFSHEKSAFKTQINVAQEMFSNSVIGGKWQKALYSTLPSDLAGYVSEFYDWDKPFSKQSKEFKKGFNKRVRMYCIKTYGPQYLKGVK